MGLYHCVRVDCGPSPRRSASSRDRRALRSREAILRAGIALVCERDTSELSVSEIATRAGVRRQVVYQEHGDRNQLLIDAAVECDGWRPVPWSTGRPRGLTGSG